MNRRKAIGGILAFTGIGVISYAGVKFFYGNADRGQLPNYVRFISEIVDVIIPPTETPGAKEAKVPDYVISFMESCSSNKEYTNFLNGLIDLRDTCLSKYNAVFEECTATQKIEVLTNLDSNTQSDGLFTKIDTKIRGRSFFSILKAVTVEGYCTSELGATQHLIYEPIPARYNAITTVKSNQKAWATK